MEANFWHKRWAENRIGFHEPQANALLVRYYDALDLPQGARIFLPLCGKTLDIGWLLSKGYRIVGAELSETAVKQLFDHLGQQPKISQEGALTRYSHPDIDIFVGDIFDLSREQLRPVDAIYDRAALVALPPAMRERYTRHLIDITARAPQLLICFTYDQSLMDGPPFSVIHSEVHSHYQDHYDLKRLASEDVAGGLKGICPAQEHIWLLQPQR